MVVSKNKELGFDAAIRDVAVLDGSLMGLVIVDGVDRVDLLHRMSTNNLRNAKLGACVATVFKKAVSLTSFVCLWELIRLCC
jgi:folate-binding Fe-S cluster repair protein YgfZ